MHKRRKKFLDELNQYLPKNIDWDEGAGTYLGVLLKDNPEAERYHLTKLFVGGQAFSSFFEEMNRFFNMVQKLNLPMKSHILGSGIEEMQKAFDLGKEL